MPHTGLSYALVLLVTLTACRGKSDETDAPTWHQDIAPVLSENCTSCHAAGGIQPDILFDDAQTASDLSAHIADAVTSRRMPPFYAAETEDCSIPWGCSLLSC
ncbi:MAG: cytochrome c [Myxococcota bacterium]|nr:cytochrome c [Myxococcota bacterium]